MSRKKLDWSLDEFVEERRKKDPAFKKVYDRLAVSEQRAISESAKTVRQLVELRKRRKLSQRSVADAIGVSQPYIARIERGTEAVGLRILSAYALAVGARISVVEEKRAPYGRKA